METYCFNEGESVELDLFKLIPITEMMRSCGFNDVGVLASGYRLVADETQTIFDPYADIIEPEEIGEAHLANCSYNSREGLVPVPARIIEVCFPEELVWFENERAGCEFALSFEEALAAIIDE